LEKVDLKKKRKSAEITQSTSSSAPLSAKTVKKSADNVKKSPAETEAFLQQIASVVLPDGMDAVYDDCDVVRMKIASSSK
jgi:hypothetical protein